MTRKRRKRSRERRDASAPAAPHMAAAASNSPDEVSREAGAADLAVSARRYTRLLPFRAGALVMVVLVAALWILRWRSAPGTWPTRHDAGLSVKLAAGGATALVFSSLAMSLARRSLSRGKRLATKLCLAAAILLVLLVLALRMHACRALYLDGMSPWNPRTSIFDDADVYYVSAVKARLKQLYGELEDRRANRPNVFSDQDQRRLRQVMTLQNCLVGWTEREVGHWLDDTQLRRGLMEVMAFQIHPTARRRDAVRDRVEVERGDLNRRRQWFAVLRDYCRRQPTADPGQRARELSEKLNRLGAGQWAYADAVVHDAGDATMVGERLNQINLSVSSMDAREAFVREYLDPMWDTPAAPGLNQKFPGLRLPVSFPHARAWAASYALLTLWHSVMLMGGAVTLLWLLGKRDLPERGAPLASIAPCWHGTVAMGIVVFVVLYCC
jgi:hypothetical protein